MKRAEALIENTKALGVSEVIEPSDILRGNPEVNLLFVAELFNANHGLDEEEAEFSNVEDSKEEFSLDLYITPIREQEE